MSSPQLEHGYTRIANKLLEHLAKELTSSGTQLAIMLLVMRYSYGYERKSAGFTIVEIADYLATHRLVVRRATQELEAKNMLIIEEKKGHHRRQYRVQKEFDQWKGKNSKGVQRVPRDIKYQKGVHKVTKGGTKSTTSKKASKKASKKVGGKTVKTDKKLTWPDWIDPAIAAEFEQHRREIRHKITPTAFNRLIAKLDRWRDKVDPNDVLINSIENGWQGIFPDKLVGRSRPDRLEKSWQKIEDAAKDVSDE